MLPLVWPNCGIPNLERTIFFDMRTNPNMKIHCLVELCANV